jgi:hypothetical protein
LFVAANPFTLTAFARNFLRALVEMPVTGLQPDTFAQGAADKLNMAFFTVGLLPAFGAGPGAAFVLFNSLALIGLAALALRRRRTFVVFALWLCLAPALIILYLQFRQQFFANRYVLFALPAYLVVIAHGLATLARRLRLAPGWAVVGLIVLLGFEFSRVLVDYHTSKDDWRRVGAFLTANVRAGDVVAAPDVQFFIRFYAPDQPGRIVDANDLGPHQQALEDGERFWFVWSDYTLLPVDEVRLWVKKLPGATIELDPHIRVIYIHPGLSQAQAEAEAAQFVVPPPTLR